MAEIPFSFGNIGEGAFVLGIVVAIFFTVVAIALIAWLVWRELQYKIPVTIHKVLGDGTITEIQDRARQFRGKENNDIRLKKLKETIPKPPADFFIKRHKGEKIYFRWDGGHLLVPQKVAYNSPLTFTPAQYNILSQMAWRIKTREERHGARGFWAEYGHVVAWSVFVILTAITLWIMFTKLELVAGSINSLASSVKGIGTQNLVPQG